MSKSLVQVLNRAAKAPRASLLGWAGKTIRLTDGDFWTQMLGRTSSSGKPVTVDSAMRLSAVWACVRLISTSVAGLPMGVYERKADGSREDARSLPLYDIVHTSPNDDMTAFQFWQAMVSSMLLWGNAYAEIRRVGDRVAALDFLLPSRIDLDCDDNGRLEYYYTPKKGGRRQIDRKNMLHIPAFTLDGRIGLSAICYGVDVFGSAMSADDAANGTFKNGLLPTVAFKVDRVLQPTQRDDFREYVKTISGALNSGKSPVLEQGITPETIGINPTDAQLLESRAFSIEEICRWYGVPPWMIGQTDKGSNWGTGLEQQMLAFLTFCISSFTNQIQQCANKRLLTAAERQRYYSEFSLEAFLRADSAGRADLYSKMTQNGIYTRDDCRVKENLPRKGGNADVLTVQSNLVPIDQLGQSNESQAVRAALMNWLRQPEPQE
ncbi:phage portal protein [Pseudomonas aeruginosa]|nr:phage portal protein [Pseudomonas aeruginosa]MCU9030887.1 phage portal protein [Pseudomonas aeruginosa]